MHDHILVDAPRIAYADVEDGHVFLIQSVLVKDSDEELDKVWFLVGVSTPTEDYYEEHEIYLHGKARIRKWKL